MSEAFGWAEFYADPEAYEAKRQERARQALLAEQERIKKRQESHYQDSCRRLLESLIARGLFRDDRLSYTYICYLEHVTDIAPSDSWRDVLAALSEAAKKDEERY